MQYTLTHIKQAILAQGFLWVRVYDANKKCVLFINEATYAGLIPEKVIQLITDFVTSVPGRYSFDFKKTSKHGKGSTMSYTNVNCYEGNGMIIPIPSEEGMTEEDRKKLVAQIRKDVRAEIEADNAIKRTKEAEAELQRHLAEIQTAGGKLNAIFNILFQAFMPTAPGQLQGQPNHTHNMGRMQDLYPQGQPPQQPQPGQMPGQYQPQQAQPQQQQAQAPVMVQVQGTYFSGQMTEQDYVRANQCLEKLLARMDVNTLEAFTNKLYNNPALIQTLTTYL